MTGAADVEVDGAAAVSVALGAFELHVVDVSAMGKAAQVDGLAAQEVPFMTRATIHRLVVVVAGVAFRHR